VGKADQASADIHVEDDWYGPPWIEPETVLLIHGVAESSRAWYAWVPQLSREFRVIRPDLPGFGQTPARPGREWSTAAFARDLTGLLDRLGLDSVHVVGAKLGGSIALQFAADFPERTRTLAVFSGPVRIKGASSDLDIHSFSERISRGGVRAWAAETQRARLGSAASDEQVAWWTDELMAKAEAGVCIAITAAASELDISPALARIQAPTLIATTEGSRLQPVEVVREYQMQIARSNLLVLPGDSYHVAAARPDDCVRHLLHHIHSAAEGSAWS